jgi:hypothetical protein
MPDKMPPGFEEGYRFEWRPDEDVPGAANPRRYQANGADTKPDTTPPPPLVKAKPFVLRDAKDIPRRQWLYDRHLIRGFVSMTVAPGGLGKSSLSIVEALAMVSGQPLLGVRVKRPLRVWLWNLEDPYDELERRVTAAALHFGLTDLTGLFVNSGRADPLVIASPVERGTGTVIHQPVVDALSAEIQALGVDALIVDPFVSSHEVSENDNVAIDRVAKTWGGIADKTETAIELIHHVKKTQPGVEITVEDGRGATALLNTARSARVLNRMSMAEGERFGIKDRPSYFKLGVGKLNLAKTPDDVTWFRIASVDLGNETEEEPSDKVGVVTRWTPPDPLAGVTSEALEAVKRECGTTFWRQDVRSTDWIGHPIGRAMGLDLGPVGKADRTAEHNSNHLKVAGLIGIWIKSGFLLAVPEHHFPGPRKKFPAYVIAGAVPD